MRHDFTHQAHHVVLKRLLDLVVSFEKGNPFRQRKLCNPHLGDANSTVRCGRAQTPGRIAGFHIALVSKTKNHFLRLIVGHHPLQNTVKDEILLHIVRALMQKRFPFQAVNDEQV